MRLFFRQTLTDYHSWNRHLGLWVSRHLFNIQHTRRSFEPSPKAKACNLLKLDLWLLFGPCEAAMMNLFLWCEGFTPLSHSLCIELQQGVGRWHRAKRNHTASLSTAVVFLRAGGPSVVHKDTDCCLLCTTTLMIDKTAWRDHSLCVGISSGFLAIYCDSAPLCCHCSDYCWLLPQRFYLLVTRMFLELTHIKSLHRNEIILLIKHYGVVFNNNGA